MRKYDFISALEKETAAEVVKNREEWMKYLITAVSFLITDFSRSKSLYQMIGFVRLFSLQWSRVYLKSIAAVSGTVYPICTLVQTGTDSSKLCIIISQITVIDIIHISI